MNEICPFCQENICASDDHIFLASIGGHTTIRSCKSCNDVFGHSFEGRAAATFLHPLLVLLRNAGVAVLDPGAKWRNAICTEDGVRYDLKIGPNGYQAETSGHVVKQDDSNPKLFDVAVGDDPAGRKWFEKSFPPERFRVLERNRLPVHFEELKLNIGTEPELKRTALKTAFAAASIAFPEEVKRFEEARQELKNGNLPMESECVIFDLRALESLDRKRKPLNHLVYVEQSGATIHAVVQFFGAFQFWIGLAVGVENHYDEALLGTLDPLTGVEEFRPLPPLHLLPWQPGVFDVLRQIKKFNEDAVLRGARPPGVLKVHQVTVDGEVKQEWRSFPVLWTGDVPKKTKQ